MTDRANNDLAALLTPAPSKGVQFSQGTILTWDNETLHNQIEWRGITLTDVPIIEGVNALTLRQGDVVGMFGWAPENSRGVGTWWILGKLTNPGEFVADLNVTAKLFRFVTEQEYPLAFFGKEIDGDPLIILYYGDEEESRALVISNMNDIALLDPQGNLIFENDSLTGVGLARPWIPYFIGPTTDANNNGTSALPGTNSAVFVPVLRGINPVYHPKVVIGFSVLATGTTEWEVRCDIGGSGEIVVGSGSGAATVTFDVPGWGGVAKPGDLGTFTLYARNTTGGFSSFGVSRFYGRQS